MAPERSAAQARLLQRLPQTRVQWHGLLSTPRHISAADGFLSGPGGRGRALSAEGADRFPAHDPDRAARAFLHEHRDLFGFGPEALSEATCRRDTVSPLSRMRTVVWEQHLDGIPVFEALLSAHTTDRGELVNISSQFLPEVRRAAAPGRVGPRVSAQRAVVLALQNLEEPAAESRVKPLPGPAAGPTRKQQFQGSDFLGLADVQLRWLPLGETRLRLCWEVVAVTRTHQEMFRVLVDAESGAIWVRRNLTAYLGTEATYRVFTGDSPAPFSPGHPVPSTNQPPATDRALVTLTALDTNASPAGWIAEGQIQTAGNNVDAHLDWDGDNVADLPRPAGAPGGVFDFPLDLEQAPGTYGQASVVQAFYLANWMHDRLYGLGFTEAAGNFQAENFDRGGLANDAVLIDVQDGARVNNANMSTPPDGTPSRMQLFLWTSPSPARDSSLDAEVLLHEYTHGLSTRTVGGGAGINALQTAGMGEGWSDFYALALLSQPDDDIHGTYPLGAYTVYGSRGMNQNYYFGIRRYPYSTDLTKNPLTFKDIDPALASAHPGVPVSPLFPTTTDPSEVHAQGEVWCVTLWEARARLIEKLGFAAGNELILQLVTDGMKLAPMDPNFVEARDAILQADRVATGGAHQQELWEAFAKRGLGVLAESPPSSTTQGIVESFEAPGHLGIRPSIGVSARGPAAGPFTVASTTFSVTNLAAQPATWSVTADVQWLNLSAEQGTLDAYASAEIVVTLDYAAYLLPAGVHVGRLTFSHPESGRIQTRDFTLRVGQSDSFIQAFDWQRGDRLDLARMSLTFVPDGSPNHYFVCREPATTFPSDPSGGTPVPVGGPFSPGIEVALPDSCPVWLYGVSYPQLYVGVGYIGFVDNAPVRFPTMPLLEGPLSSPGIFMAFNHYDGMSGTVSWKRFDDRIAVTFQDMLSAAGTNQAQVELFFDGRLRLTWLDLDLTSSPFCVAGLSEGAGMPEDFEESDLSQYPACMRLVLPPHAQENDGLLAGQGTIQFPGLATSNHVVELASSDPASVTVPSQVTIPAGASQAQFDLRIGDDNLLDGTQPVRIRVASPRFGKTEATLGVDDNESAALLLTVPPTAIEGQEPVDAVVTASAAPDCPVWITLQSDNTNALRVPPAVLLPAGQTQAMFTAHIVDDPLVDGSEAATLTAHVVAWEPATHSLTVADNEPRTLLVQVPPVTCEGIATLTGAGHIRLPGPMVGPLIVTLESSHPSRIAVPNQIILPTGAASATFDLTVIDNADLDGDQPVAITVAATDWSGDSHSILVRDDEAAIVPSSPSPAQADTDIPASTRLSWETDAPLEALIVNGDFETGDFTGWSRLPGPDEAMAGSDIRINDGGVNPPGPERATTPYAGYFSAVSAPAVGTVHELYQDITLPGCEGAVRLRWVDRIRNHAAAFGGDQQFRVEIRDPEPGFAPGVDTAVLFSTQAGDPLMGDWTGRDIDISRFRGLTVRLAFVIVSRTSYLNVHLDNIQIEADPNPIPTLYDVYLGTDPGLTTATTPIATTTNRFFEPPLLAPQTTYYWQVAARRSTVAFGPVWQFTTRGVHHFAWDTIPSPQTVGQAFAATLSAQDEFGQTVTGFTGTVTIEGRQLFSRTTNSMLGALSSNSSGNYGDWTYGYAFTPHTNLWVTHVRYQFGHAVSIWTDDGQLLIRQPVQSTPGHWRETPLPQPLLLNAGQRYRIGAYTAQGPYHFALTGPSDFSEGLLHEPLAAVGNDLPTLPDGARWWLVDIRYVAEFSQPVSVTPSTSAQFNAGTWTGPITVLEPATHLVLHATDPLGHIGSSAPLAVDVPTLEPDVALAGVTLFQETFAPTNQLIDAGERVRINLAFQLLNATAASNLVVTLLSTEGIANPSEGQSYDALSPESPTQTRSFWFTADGSNGSPITAWFDVQHNGRSLGRRPWTFHIGPVPDFAILSLSTNDPHIASPPAALSGGGQAGLSTCASNLYVSGLQGTLALDLDTLTQTTSLDASHPLLAGNLRSEKTYLLARGTHPLDAQRSQLDTLIEFDRPTGQTAPNRIRLDTPIDTGTPGPDAPLGIFSGLDRILLHTPDGHIWSIALPWGTVTELGQLPHAVHHQTSDGVFWGIAEHFAGEDYLVYVRDSTTIVRRRMRDGATAELETFTDLGPVAALAVSLSKQRWFFQHEGTSQFGDGTNVIGSCIASFSFAENLRIHSFTTDAAGTRLAFPTLAGKLYQVERCENLTIGSWAPVEDPLLGNGRVMETVAPAGGPLPRAFYRVRADLVGPPAP